MKALFISKGITEITSIFCLHKNQSAKLPLAEAVRLEQLIDYSSNSIVSREIDANRDADFYHYCYFNFKMARHNLRCDENRLNGVLVEQFKKGKHAMAWAAMKAIPTAHMQPMALIEGMKGCGGCHKIGLKSEAELKELSEAGSGFGRASRDACHTRHLFSKAEAREPQSCQTCT